MVGITTWRPEIRKWQDTKHVDSEREREGEENSVEGKMAMRLIFMQLAVRMQCFGERSWSK